MEPPKCVQNAMMTKDKKPFTYTPGGIDLSEVKSPRMQRRIERNATLGGASDFPQQAPQPQHVGPLPPAALAAMRPQTQVQVFPCPPPPPPMKNIPPPPPPPTAPLPTQKVMTGDNQVLERPDMTKIIPDNPMALLRKTGGPAPRKSFVEHMYEEQDRAPPSPPQRTYEVQSPGTTQPPVIERSAPVQQQRQPQSYQPQPQQYQPPTPPQSQSQPQYQPVQPPKPQYQPVQPPQPQYQQHQPQYQPAQTPQPQYQPVQAQYRPAEPTGIPSYQPPVIERQPNVGRQDQPQKTVSSSVGSLYIPPLNQQQQPPQQQRFATPPTPPERQPQVQSPGTPPTLKEAPRPWQQKNFQQQQDVPPWAKEVEERIQTSQQPQAAPSQRWQQPARPAQQEQPAPQQVRQPPSQPYSPRSPPTQQQPQRSPQAQNQPYPSNSFPVHIEIRSGPYPQDPEPEERKPNAVYITQPVVLQHPGPMIAPPYQGQPKFQQQQQQSQNSYQQPRQQQVQQKPKVDSSGARVIPIQIERTPPTTPAADNRGLSRQLSWGTQPPQSNSFKVIQKITRTDDDEDDDTPITQHSPRYPQEMPEQVRRMKINDNGHFKQGNGQPQPYVHPSEQVVPEPKKYMGSNIPSRSFKILQAMTAPSDGCANANYNEELHYNHPYNPYNYPYYPPPPYWPDYYPNYYPQEPPEQPKHNDKTSSRNGRSTPLPSAAPYASPAPPYWHDYYSNFYPQQQSDSSSKMSDKSSSTSKSGRSTPLPNVAPPMPSPLMQPSYWGYLPPNMPASSFNVRSQSTPPKPESILRPQTPKPSEYQNSYTDEALQYQPYPMYPPYYDPYYYGYYYGYPTMMPPYPYYHHSSTDNEEYSGYSSQDEMSTYNNGRKSTLKRRNSLDNSANNVHALRQHFEVRSKSATPMITITPSFSQEKLNYNGGLFKTKDNKDSETEVEDEESQKGNNLCRLRSVKSIQNINVFAAECSETETSESEESTDEDSEDDEEILIVRDVEEIIPHQLSVIYEESERGDSRRSFRASSAASETTTIADHSEEEDFEDFLATQNVKYKINMFQETCEQLSVKTTKGNIVKTFEQETESFASLSVKNQHSMNDRSVFENKTDQSRCVVTRYGSDTKQVQEEKHKNTTISQNTEKVRKEIENKNLEVRNEYLINDRIVSDNRSDQSEIVKRVESEARKTKKIEPDNIRKTENTGKIKTSTENTNLNVSYSSKKDKEVEPQEIKIVVNSENNKGKDQDWWSVIESGNEVKESGKRESSIKQEEKECDKSNSKAENVMVREEESEGVCVKLRNKNGARRNSSNLQENSTEHKESNENNIFSDILFNTDSGYNRSSVYDILKDDEAIEEIESGGTLMKVGSFVSALEAIKRNSGLWNFDEIDFSNSPTIKEESAENESSDTIKKDNNTDELSDKDECNDINNDKCDETSNFEVEAGNQESDGSEIDFWSQIKNDEDDFQPKRRSHYFEETQDIDYYNTQADNMDYKNTEEKESDSASSRNSSFSKSQENAEITNINRESEINQYNGFSQEECHNNNENYSQSYEENNENSDETSDSDSSDEEKEEPEVYVEEEKRNSNSRSRSLEPQTIKERIEALKNSIAKKQKILQEREDIPVSVKSKISAIEVSAESRSKTTSTKSSVKSFEEYSEEEEGDSGVISDISRHISDNEEFPELKKLTRYERAATHSRLFKLLQDECDIEEEEEEDEVFVQQEDKFNKLSIRQNKEQNKLTPSRSKLSLALNKQNDNTNGPQVNEKLVDELVQSLLRSRKAQVFRSMPKEKLRAAAIIILQEGIEGCETPSEEFSSLVSPLRGETQNSTPAQTPQEFYADNGDYKQYYESWNEEETFKLLQEHIGASKLGTIEGILAKYPKILSNKNISKEILKHLDELSSDYSSSYSRNPPQSNDVTNT